MNGIRCGLYQSLVSLAHTTSIHRPYGAPSKPAGSSTSRLPTENLSHWTASSRHDRPITEGGPPLVERAALETFDPRALPGPLGRQGRCLDIPPSASRAN